MKTRFTVLALLAGLLAGSSLAQEAPPDAATLLFDTNQLAMTHAGDVIAYAYSRNTADDAKYGRSYADTIRLKIATGEAAETRTLDVEMFSGGNRRPAGPFQSMTGNPILSLFLENHIEALSAQFHANPRYLKNAIRAALRDRATVKEGPVEVGGRSVPGLHVRTAPFEADPNKGRMLGLETLTYEFAVAKSVPGEVVEIRALAPGPDGKALLDERIVYDAHGS